MGGCSGGDSGGSCGGGCNMTISNNYSIYPLVLVCMGGCSGGDSGGSCGGGCNMTISNNYIPLGTCMCVYVWAGAVVVTVGGVAVVGAI